MATSSLAVTALCSALLGTIVWQRTPESEAPPRNAGLVTLYARDDLACALDLRTGGGARVLDGEVRLEGTQLVYDALDSGRLSVGFSFDERVSILDLGEVYVPPRERTRDRAIEYPLALFHTLAVDGPRFFYRGPGGGRHEFEDASGFLSVIPAPGVVHLEPLPGHTYLLRARSEGLRGADDLFKLHVIEHRPGESVTLRWARVPGP